MIFKHLVYMAISLAPLRQELSEKTVVSCISHWVVTARQKVPRHAPISAHLGLTVNFHGIVLQNEGKCSYIELLV